MPLPLPWIDKIFDKLTMVYGHHFIGRWSGLDLNAVKGDWAHELDGMEKHPEAIKHALQNLPVNDPPTVLQFREMCRRAPGPTFVALPMPEVNKELAAKALSEAAKVTRHQGDVLTPIRRLMRQEIEGSKGLTKTQREFWRVALRNELLSDTGIDTSQPFALPDLAKALEQRRAA